MRCSVWGVSVGVVGCPGNQPRSHGPQVLTPEPRRVAGRTGGAVSGDRRGRTRARIRRSVCGNSWRTSRRSRPRLGADARGAPMFSVDLSTTQRDSHVVVASRGDLDVADAARVAFASGVAAAREPEIAVGLAGLPSRGPRCDLVWAGHSRSRPGRCAAASRALPPYQHAIWPGRGRTASRRRRLCAEGCGVVRRLLGGSLSQDFVCAVLPGRAAGLTEDRGQS